MPIGAPVAARFNEVEHPVLCYETSCPFVGLGARGDENGVAADEPADSVVP